MPNLDLPIELELALEAGRDCANCGRSFREHCFVRGADCGMYSPVIDTTGETLAVKKEGE